VQEVKGVGCEKHIWAQKPSPRVSQQQKKKSTKKGFIATHYQRYRAPSGLGLSDQIKI
jgi:hypothetical protein